MNSARQSEASSETASARKLIAIGHAGIAGYSRHIGRDDAGTLDRVRMIRRDLIDPELRKHGGRLVNTAGDALLIEFASITAAVPRPIMVTCHGLLWSRAARERGRSSLEGEGTAKSRLFDLTPAIDFRSRPSTVSPER